MTNNSAQKIVQLVANQIGVESSEIETSDTFTDDLHMTAADISVFVESLQNAEFDITVEDMTDIETVEDLIEFLTAEEEL